MKRSTIASVFLAAALLAPQVQASESLVSFEVMTLETAQKLAEAALTSCRENDYQVSVAVVDRFGTTQVMLRDRFAGPHSPETARRKAWTAVSFRSDTVELAGATKSGQPQAGARDIPGVLMLGGGVPVTAAGSIVGGVGVSGAPSGEADDACARAGIDAVEADLAF